MNPFQSDITKAAISWVTTQIGSFQVIDAYRTGSTRTGVWRVKSDQGSFFFKINRRRNRWGTEVYVYQHWASAFTPYIPDLRGIYDHDTNPGLLLAEVPGCPLREAKLNHNALDRAYYRAGQLLRRLHDLAVGQWFGCVDEKGRPMDWSGNPLQHELQQDVTGQKLNMLRDTIQTGISLNCFSKFEHRMLEWAIDSVECFASEVPIPTSEDYTPGNWLVDSNGDLVAVIDFENMLWGERMLPFGRLLNDYFPYYPSGEQSFYEGYGGCPPREQPEQAKIECILYSGYYVTVGVKTNNEGYIRRGREAFKRIRD